MQLPRYTVILPTVVQLMACAPLLSSFTPQLIQDLLTWRQQDLEVRIGAPLTSVSSFTDPTAWGAAWGASGGRGPAAAAAIGGGALAMLRALAAKLDVKLSCRVSSVTNTKDRVTVKTDSGVWGEGSGRLSSTHLGLNQVGGGGKLGG